MAKAPPTSARQTLLLLGSRWKLRLRGVNAELSTQMSRRLTSDGTAIRAVRPGEVQLRAQFVIALRHNRRSTDRGLRPMPQMSLDLRSRRGCVSRFVTPQDSCYDTASIAEFGSPVRIGDERGFA